MNEKEQPVVLVTGGSRGIGAEVCRVFSRRGYAVVVNYREDKKSADALKEELTTAGGSAITVQADVSDERAVSEMFEYIHERFGHISVLVNNAGILKTQSSFADISPERIRRVFEVNVIGSMLCAQQAIKHMNIVGRGVIVNVSSGASCSGSPNEYVDYAASKGAIDSFTIGLAKELAPHNIRVNAVRPGMIHTDIHASGGEPGRVDRLAAKIPMGRGGQAKEVAEAIYWLASDKSSYTTGSFVDVRGGL